MLTSKNQENFSSKNNHCTHFRFKTEGGRQQQRRNITRNDRKPIAIKRKDTEILALCATAPDTETAHGYTDAQTQTHGSACIHQTATDSWQRHRREILILHILCAFRTWH